jgi:hypothetical protein
MFPPDYVMGITKRSPTKRKVWNSSWFKYQIDLLKIVIWSFINNLTLMV